MELVDALQRIQGFLVGLKDTGPGGFEGLVAVLCEAATGQRFRISGSGPQEGQDLRAEPGAGNLIKVEAKHYGKDKLNLRELEGELAQAAFADSGVDLWVLAASCRVNDEHAKKLEADAHRLNVEVLFLDMGNDGLSRLAVLMAAFPDAVENWIGLHSVGQPLAPLRDALAVIRTGSQFVPANEQLLGKLRSTLLGYEDARQRVMRRFLSVVTDRGDCVARFNQDVALRAHGARPIDRSSVRGAFTAWWNSGSPARKRVVALGEEGSGKTWAAMAWASNVIDDGSMPLFVPFNAHVAAISERDSLETYLPGLLAEWTHIGTTESWTGRLKRWLARRSQEVLIVVLADGLNERPNINWPTFFRTLEDSSWRDAVCLIATDRPGHWRPSCAMAGMAGFHEIEIGGYTDAELSLALEGTGVTVSRIPEHLQPLIRKPRYCKLVALHFEEMEREGDTSLERLILLDSRHRCEERRGHPLNTTQFNDVIRELASKYRERPYMTRRDIEDLLPQRDPDGRIYQEIVDGGMLVAREQAPSTFTIERTRLVYGLGILLADDLGTAAAGASRSELQERIAGWFEPHPEMDLKVRVCSSALFHALIDDRYPPIARRELLRYWLGLRNWLDEWQDTSLQCIVRCPDDFIAIVEDFWHSSHDRGAAQDLLGRAFVKYRDDVRVESVLVSAVERWMSVVNRSGHPVMRHDEARTQKMRTDIVGRVGGSIQAGSFVTVAGEPLLVIDDDGLSRLPRLGLLVISAGSRGPYTRALARWALAGAVMGGALEYQETEWVCRLAQDDIETQLLSYAEKFLAEDSLAHDAAHTLLGCLGTARAEQLRLANPLPESEFARKRREDREIDPCLAWEPWTDEDCERCMGRTDIRPGVVVGKLGIRLMAPDYAVPSVLIARACALMNSIDKTTLRSLMGRTAEDHALEEVWPLLASRESEALAAFLRETVRTLPARPELGKRQITFWLDEFTSILGPEEVKVILNELSALHTQLNEAGDSRDGQSESQTIEEFLFLACLPHLPVEQRLKALLDRPSSAQDLMDLRYWYESLPALRFAEALEALRSTADSRAIFRTLWFLGATREPLTDSQCDLLVSLMSNEDPLVRGACMRFACMNGNKALGRRLVDIGMSYVDAKPSWESHWGNQLISLFSDHLPFEVAASRVHPSIAGYLLDSRGNVPTEVDVYAMTLHHAWQRIIEAADPDLASLPVVLAKKRAARLESDLPEFRDEESRELKSSNWTTTWTSGRPPEKSIAEAFAALQEDPTPKINQRAREQVEAITTAWTMPALEWFGRDFSRAAFRAIHERLPELLPHWIEPGLRLGKTGRAVRLRLGSFLVDVCAVLLEKSPTLGLQIWEALRVEHSVPIHFDTAKEAFLAPSGHEGDLARDRELAECWDDEGLSRLARLAEAEQKTGWLREAVQELLGDSRLWKRAKGLALASYSNISIAKFDAMAAQANITQTWVERPAKAMRDCVRSNELAKNWYRTYLTEPSVDKAWGAYQMMLECGDERFYTWCRRIESEGGVTIDRKLRFVAASWQSTKRALNREKKRKDHLFGLSVPKGQILPFVEF